MTIKTTSAFALTLLLMLSGATHSTMQAVTSDGKVVVLMDNNTWKYQDSEDKEASEIKMNPKKFAKSSDAKFKVNAGETGYSIYIDPKKWQFKPREDGDESRFSFESKKIDLYALAIFEQAAIELPGFKEIALNNARAAAPDVALRKEEYREVNSQKVLYLEFGGTVSGMKINYYAYYASNEAGSIQLLVFSGSNVKVKPEDVEELLNGLVLEAGQK